MGEAFSTPSFATTRIALLDLGTKGSGQNALGLARGDGRLTLKGGVGRRF